MNSASRQAAGPLIVDLDGAYLTDDERRLLQHPAVGGVIFFSRNFKANDQLRALTAEIRALRPTLLCMADTEGGRVQRFRSGFTRIPPMRRLGAWLDTCSESDVLHGAREIAWLMASELRDVGVDLPLAPVVDVALAQSEVIGDRAFSDTAADVARLARAFAAGLVDAGSVATAKHFPGHGAVSEDSHACLPVDKRPWSAIADDMAPYRMLIADGLASIMMAHIRYPEIDDLPASLSHHWITTIVRGQLSFDGCVFCDDLSMNGAAGMGDHPTRARAALAAGCDFLPLCHDRENVEKLLDIVVAADNDDALARRRRLVDTIGGRNRSIDTSTPESHARGRAAQTLCERLSD